MSDQQPKKEEPKKQDYGQYPDAVRAQLIALDKLERIPTAEPGDIVLFYDHGNKSDRPRVAIVLERQGVAKIRVRMQDQVSLMKEGVLHMSHEVHQKKGTNNPGWEYKKRDLNKIPAEHYALHNEEIERRKQNLINHHKQKVALEKAQAEKKAALV